MSSPSQNDENLIAEEGPRVLGIGLGLFFLILLWAFAFVTILSFSRYSSVTSIIILSIASLITITALTLPRYPPFEKAVDEVEPRRLYDTPFIWRMILTFIMGVSLVFAAFSSLLKHAMEQVYAEPIRRRPHYQATKS